MKILLIQLVIICLTISLNKSTIIPILIDISPPTTTTLPPQPPPLPSNTTKRYKTINKCNHQVWVGIQGNSKLNTNFKLPFNGGWLLNPNETNEFEVPIDFVSKIWARTNCKLINGLFKCDTGDCGSNIQCAFDGIQRLPLYPASVASISLGLSQDTYNINLINGYNIKLGIYPQRTECLSTLCSYDLNDLCPSDLKAYNSTKQQIGCLTPCERFNTDEYCCRNIYNSQDTCNPAKWSINYVDFFKRACPGSISYSYDNSSGFTCKNTGYNIVFC